VGVAMRVAVGVMVWMGVSHVGAAGSGSSL